MSAKASGADASGGQSTQNRNHTPGNQSRAYTPEQKAAVIRVRKCSHTAFYEILAVEQSATETEIKKAYRKLSLLTHPDKNGYNGADEAFKMVSRAFQILSDPDKKAKYDRFGGDPDSRFGAGGGGGGGGAANPFEGFARSTGGGRGPMFEEEISPEELFQRFFGGGFGGGPFGGGGFGGGPFGGGQPFVFNMGGGPGFRVHQFGGRPRRRPREANAQDEQQSPMSILQNLLPLIILFAVTILSSFFSSFGDSQPSIPEIRLAADPPFTLNRVMPAYGVNYFLNPQDIQDLSISGLKKLDRQVESEYIQTLQIECQNERRRRQRAVEDAQGWFFPDPEKMKEARQMQMRHCDKLMELRAPLQY